MTFNRAWEELEAIYPALPGGMRPAVGRAFAGQAPGLLRVLALGINPYVAEGDLGNDPAGKWLKWWYEKEDRFFKLSRQALDTLGMTLENTTFFPNLAYHSEDSVYATNFVKFFQGHEKGKHAALLKAKHMQDGERLWQRELDELARKSVLPHVVVVLGWAAWRYVWPCFRAITPEQRFTHMRPSEGCEDELPHHAARHVVGDHRGAQPLLLVRLKHPGRGQTDESLQCLLRNERFRKVAGLVPHGHGAGA